MAREQEETKWPSGQSSSRTTFITAGFLIILVLVFAASWWFGNSRSESVGFFLGSIGLATGLTALTWYDVREFRLPNILTLSLISAGLIVSYADARSDFLFHLVGAFVGYALIYLLWFCWHHFRGYPGIGLGDAKLFAAGGAWCGLISLPFIMLISSGTGIFVTVLSIVFGSYVTKASKRYLPFGPLIGLGIWICWNFRSLLEL